MNQKLAEALQNCSNEPIHIPGSVQPHGVLLVVSKAMIIKQVSSNLATFVEQTPKAVLGQSLAIIVGQIQCKEISCLVTQSIATCSTQIIQVRLEKNKQHQTFDAVINAVNQLVIIELEPVVVEQSQVTLLQTVQTQLEHFTSRLQKAKDIAKQSQIVAEEVRQITQFGRVKVYQFDSLWNGCVIAESKVNHMESFLGHHFPASDIPEQARRLYTKNPIRLIPNVNYVPSLLIGKDHINTPLDLSFSVLRSVSPVHIQYLKNMGIKASMSISILQEDKLWGLICCHHDEIQYVPYSLRVIVELMARIVAMQLSALSITQEFAYNAEVQKYSSEVMATIRHQNNSQTINHFLTAIMHALKASGLVIRLSKQLYTAGVIPQFDQLKNILKFTQTKAVTKAFVTNELCGCLEIDINSQTIASGLIAVPFGNDDMILWFRPEIVQTLKWAGNPNITKDIDPEKQILSPRKSFSLWKQIVKGRSESWTKIEIKIAYQLADAIHTFQLDQELKRSNEELKNFAYMASHDLQEPLRTIVGFTNLLTQKYNHQIDEDAQKYLDFTRSAAYRMQSLITDLLEYTQISQSIAAYDHVDLQQVFEEVKQNLQASIVASNAKILLDDLPTVYSCRIKLIQLIQNLLSNSIKYRKLDSQLEIRISHEKDEKYWQFSIEDNGIGMKTEYCQQIFLPFKRLHTNEKYVGTGIGLSICKKIVEQLGGEIWAESSPNQGSIFYFTLPKAN